jgi:propanol-preferring alcohol dehydrogenase
VAIDTGDAKRKMCMDLGAEAFIDFKEVEDTTAEVIRITKGGAHAVVVTGGCAADSRDIPHARVDCFAVSTRV